VGYRALLINRALAMGLDNFNAYNLALDGTQKVVVLFQGEDDEYREYLSFVKSQRPERAEVADITEEDYPGRVPPIDRCIQAFQMNQWGRGIPVLLEIRDNTSKMLEKQDETIHVIKDESEKTRETVRKESGKTRVVLSSVIRDEGEKTRETFSGHPWEDIAELRQEIADIRATLARVLEKVGA
jgi:acylphosphatase